MLELIKSLALFWMLAIAVYALADVGLRLIGTRLPDESRHG